MLSRRNESITTLGRAGFTLLEMVIAVAIIAVLGGAVVVGLSGYRERQKVNESHDILRALAATLFRYDTALAAGANPPTAGRYPLQLYHLSNLITSTATTNCALCRNSCGGTATPALNSVYSTTNVTGWTTNGPFFNRDVVLGVGFSIPIGLVRDSLVRTPATAANADNDRARLQIRIDTVLLEHALDLNAMVDGDAGGGTGTVQWSATPDGSGRLSSIFWTLPIRGC